MRTFLASTVWIFCLFLFGCSTDDRIPRGYYPQTIEDIVFEEDSGGRQFLDYINNGGDSIVVLNYTLFESGSYSLNALVEKELIDLAVVLKTYGDYDISIEGHTNNQGNEDANLELSERRASSVLNFLLNEWISFSRLEATGYGEERPRATNDTAEGRQLNQRVEIAILN